MRKPKITITEQPTTASTESAKALWWRQHIARITREGLSRELDISEERIRHYERGYGRTGKPFAPGIWAWYKWHCYWYHCKITKTRCYPLDALEMGKWNWGIE